MRMPLLTVELLVPIVIAEGCAPVELTFVIVVPLTVGARPVATTVGKVGLTVPVACGAGVLFIIAGEKTELPATVVPPPVAVVSAPVVAVVLLRAAVVAVGVAAAVVATFVAVVVVPAAAMVIPPPVAVITGTG
jgi:hypothetical protein